MKSGRLLAVNLPYTLRDKQQTFSDTENPRFFQSSQFEVLNIRGDFRDYLAARRLFKDIKIRMSGWVPFCARRMHILDWPFAAGLLPVRNRYRAWETLAGIPPETETGSITPVPASGQIILHMGAQWRSKQYPHTAELIEKMHQRGFEVSLLLGPDDPLPPGIDEKSVSRPTGAELVSKLKTAGVVVTNDSGPMHLAAYLGKPTVTIVLASNIAEWVPPGVLTVHTASMPKGYRPLTRYVSDETLEGWPASDDVINSVMQFVSSPGEKP